MIRVLLVDDQEMIRVGLRTIIESQDDVTVAGETGDGFAALQHLERAEADVVLLDIRMPGIDGVETVRRIRLHHAADRTRILMLTTFEHDDLVVAALRAGADGFLGKTAGPEDLLRAIRSVHAGAGALSPAAQAAVIREVASAPVRAVDPELVERFKALTLKERDVVLAIAAGGDNERIAKAMFISPFTVKTHANRAMAKLDARDRASLVTLVYRAGLLN